jgi:hypothetical protein
MQKIEPAYVSFQQAKWLKRLGYRDFCTHYHFEDGEFREHSIKTTVGMDYGSDIEYKLEEFYENWNDKGVTKKNGERCWGCDKTKGYFETFSAPEQWQVVEWLRVNHGVWVVAIPMLHNGVTLTYYPSIFEQGVGEDIEKYFNSPREAYSEAFNYIMQHILIA